MINTYEMMFILRPDLSQEQVNKELHKYRDFLKNNDAQKVSLQIWGKRRLAYPIQKFQDGIYVLTHYTGDGTQVAKIEKAMRLSEEVIRYLTLKLESDFEFEEKGIPEFQSTSSEPKPVPATSSSSSEEVASPQKPETVEEKPQPQADEVAVEA